MLSLEVALLSDRGGRNYNEDAWGHWHSERHLCCVLADGAGGHGGGDIASRLVVEHLLRSFATQPGADGGVLEWVSAADDPLLVFRRIRGPAALTVRVNLGDRPRPAAGAATLPAWGWSIDGG
mgnify:CR=1 FL=1